VALAAQMAPFMVAKSFSVMAKQMFFTNSLAASWATGQAALNTPEAAATIK